MDLVIFDLETTGLSPREEEIIQIAAVRMRGRQILEEESFHTFVDPGRPIPPFIREYTGVTDDHVRGAPSIAEALAAFSRFAGDGILVAHNGYRFDMPFVHEACRKCGLATRAVHYSDSLDLSKRLWPQAPRHGMDHVMERLGMRAGDLRRHDARGDVGLLAEAIIRMWEALGTAPDTLPVPTYQGFLPAAGPGFPPTS